jgi:hypothetical protein
MRPSRTSRTHQWQKKDKEGHMRKITTAITAAALAFSMVAAAVPANAAVPGYDSAYAGESAFVNISAGQTQNFQVFFANTGTTSWQRGTATQVDLAACLEDKVTCNQQDASEATWNSGWLSAVRYASTVQTVTPPGSLGTFSYNITAPAGVAGGIYRFNGDLVLASTGEKIHPEGYYQEANTGAPTGAATITSLTPSSGTSAGGTAVTIAGSGFVCTPAFPTVSFGGTNGIVTSCGASSIGVSSPAHAPGAVTVTVSNSGAPASNGLTYNYLDTSAPTFTGIAVAGSLVTVTFSEPVCRAAAWLGTDWTINNISSGTTDIPDAGDSIPLCNTAADNGVTSANLDVAPATVTPGAFVEVTLNTRDIGVQTPELSDNESMRDSAGNFVTAPQARQATATAPETTAPTITTITGAVGSTSMTLNFSEPVYCTGFNPVTMITITDNNSATTDPTATGFTTNTCGGTPTTADSSFGVTLSSALPADRTYSVTVTPAGTIQDVVGNDLATQTVVFTTGAGDFTPPTMIDARMVNNLVTTDFSDAGDSFSLTFSETMNGVTTGQIGIQDQDGTTATIVCSAATGANQASCTWNTAVTTVTVTLTGTLGPASGTTPLMQIPFNVTTLTSFQDLQGNPPNVLGSADRLVDFET